MPPAEAPMTTISRPATDACRRFARPPSTRHRRGESRRISGSLFDLFVTAHRRAGSFQREISKSEASEYRLPRASIDEREDRLHQLVEVDRLRDVRIEPGR